MTFRKKNRVLNGWLNSYLFLKMADEQARPPFNKKSEIPQGLDWSSMLGKQGAELDEHYHKILEMLGKEAGMLGLIFGKSQNKIQDPAKLRHLVEMINDESWVGLNEDIKGAIYEGLLEKNAEDVKGGAGQYFTPRPLIRAIVEVIRPKPDETICDPACGTGGFLLAAYDYVSDRKNYDLDERQKTFLRHHTLKGKDIVTDVVRLCAMNLYLHGIGEEGAIPVEVGDSLDFIPKDDKERYDLVLTNPPFGKKSSITIVNGEGKADREALTYSRQDFWATTSNKQLNFLQHVKTLLKTPGRAAIVVPDNVLFEGGAGETVRRRLLQEFEVHTLLRLPTGVFYAQGVKANVLFFDCMPASETPLTKRLWIYDLRTNQHFTLKTNPLNLDDLQNFIKCYNIENRHDRKETERFRAFSYEDLVKRDKASLDIFWLKDESLEDSDNLPDPAILAREIVESLETALEQFRGIEDELKEAD
jgi:type I restriction enzyme M protein